MIKEKSPFKSFTVEEVFNAEATNYTIQVGSDFYCHDGGMVFSKKTAALFYNKILGQVINMMNNGNTKQKQSAHRILRNLKVLPLRIN